MAISRPRLIEQEGLLGRAAPQRVVAAPVAAPVSQPPVVAAPAPVATQARAPIAAAPKVGWQDMMNSLPNKDPGYGAVLGSGRIQAMVDTEKAQRDWFNTYHPELFKDIGWGNAENQTGWRIGYDDGTPILYRWRSDLGNVTEQRPISPDGTLGNVRWGQYDSGNGVIDALKVAAPIALSAFGAPYLAGAFGGGLGATIGAGALTGAAGSAIAGGDPLKGAVMGGIGGGIGYGVNNSGLLGSPTELATTNTLPTDLGLPTIEPIVPVELNLPDALPMPSGLPSVASLPGTSSIGSVLSSVPGYDLSSVNFPPTPAPGYSLGNPSLELPGGGLNLPPSNPLMDSLLPSVGVNNPPPVVPDLPTPTRALDSQLANEQLGIRPGENSVAPSTPAVEADPSLIERGVATGRQLLAAGKDAEFYKWVTDPANSLYVKAMMAGGGALLNTVGGESKSGGSNYKDDGYRPTISRGGFQASIPAPGRPSGGPGMAAMSGITLPSTGQANDGLWRYAGNRNQSGLLPSLSAAMPRSLISPPMAPQTGLISPPAVSYNPRPTGPLPTNLPPMQYGYDDPVVNSGPQLTPEQQRLMSPLLGLLNTNPAPRGWM